MPRSKRAKVVHLSKVDKKGKELKQKTFNNIRESAHKYPYIFVFSVDNMRNNLLKDVRAQLSDSRLFFGKTKVMAKALGSTPASEAASNTHLLTPHLHGAVGLIFTHRPIAEITSYLTAFRPLDYARAGTKASRSFTLPAGTVYSRGGEISTEEDVPLAHSIEPMLRKLGVPSRLVKGRVELDGKYDVCKEGDVLGSAQTTLLKMFGVATAEFKVGLRACWMGMGEEAGKVVVLDESGDGEEDGDGRMEADGGEEDDE